ncbi:hypothetical protein LXL04_018129 [Taraxacum kok-saghyz]
MSRLWGECWVNLDIGVDPAEPTLESISGNIGDNSDILNTNNDEVFSSNTNTSDHGKNEETSPSLLPVTPCCRYYFHQQQQIGDLEPNKHIDICGEATCVVLSKVVAGQRRFGEETCRKGP